MGQDQRKEQVSARTRDIATKLGMVSTDFLGETTICGFASKCVHYFVFLTPSSAATMNSKVGALKVTSPYMSNPSTSLTTALQYLAGKYKIQIDSAKVDSTGIPDFRKLEGGGWSKAGEPPYLEIDLYDTGTMTHVITIDGKEIDANVMMIALDID